MPLARGNYLESQNFNKAKVRKTKTLPTVAGYGTD